MAGTLNFETGRHLYGRYWGCLEEREMLHFELCYYRLIERAVDRGYTRFEAGAQGEHKLKRGLSRRSPTAPTGSPTAGLSAAVGRFLEAEAPPPSRSCRVPALSPYARGRRALI